MTPANRSLPTSTSRRPDSPMTAFGLGQLTSKRDDVPWSDAVREDVEGRLFQALAVLRIVLVVNMVGLNVVRAENFDRPLMGLVVGLILVSWTGAATWAYATPARRSRMLLIVDLVVAVVAILASWWVKGEDVRATIPGFWVMAPLLAWAVHWGWRGGAFAAVLLSAADVAIRAEFTQVNYSNVFLLLLGGPLVGYLSDSLKAMAVQRDEAQRAVTAAAERARLARAVHDGVLQVLALVQRRGLEVGGDFEDLGKLAGAQEVALRALIRQQDALPDSSAAELMDVAAKLARLESLPSPRVHVATPGHRIEIDQSAGLEVLAAVTEALSNTARHVGPEADAWVLLEAVGSDLIVSVRDEGGGIDEGRLALALDEGRLGVAESILGRLSELGGEAVLTTGSWGTEWEFTVPLGHAKP